MIIAFAQSSKRVCTRESSMSLTRALTNGELWGLTAYFNPVGYVNKHRHLERFAQSVRQQGLKLAIVELAFNDAPYVVNHNLADIIIRVRSSTVLWQKERLLNIAVKHLPMSCDKIAWIDADILFGNFAWVEDTCKALERFAIVQPYDLAWWLPPGVATPPQQLKPGGFLFVMQGFAFSRSLGPNSGFPQGHCGFAWAARRSLIETHGFYDRLVLGGGDLAMACSMYNDVLVGPSQALLEELCSEEQIRDMHTWKASFYKDVGGNVGYVSGTVFHLWHGAHDNRNYRGRYKILKEAEFDPAADLAIDDRGCWRWNSNKPDLHKKVRDYFWCRREDEDRKPPAFVKNATEI
jgi:hypothetical protein